MSDNCNLTKVINDELPTHLHEYSQYMYLLSAFVINFYSRDCYNHFDCCVLCWNDFVILLWKHARMVTVVSIMMMISVFFLFFLPIFGTTIWRTALLHASSLETHNVPVLVQIHKPIAFSGSFRAMCDAFSDALLKCGT